MSNEPVTRKERERQAHRREILAGARSVFTLKGFADTTMDEIATAAEFGKGTIYTHFSSKEELFVAVIEDVLGELAGTVAAAVENEYEFPERIELLVRGILEYAVSSPRSLYLVTRELRVPVLGGSVRNAVEGVLLPLTRAIGAEQHAGRMVQEIKPDVLANVLMNMIVSRFLVILRESGGETETGAHCHALQHASLISAGMTAARLSIDIEDAVATVRRIFLHGAVVTATDRNPKRTSITRRKTS